VIVIFLGFFQRAGRVRFHERDFVLEATAVKKFGIYGGTFDPIHHGHLILARDVIEHLRLDALCFVPCSISPHKTESPSASGVDRIAMIRMAIEGESQMQVSDFELLQPGLSYTINTVEHFRLAMPDAKLFWLLGADQKKNMASWHRYDELMKKVDFFFMARESCCASGGGTGRRIDISATEIRARIAAGLTIRHWVPDGVAAYIKEKGLYKR